MSQTNIASGAADAKKLYGAALFARSVTAPNFVNNLTGPAPKQSDAEAKLKGQTKADMPIVRVTDLSKGAGEAVTVDAYDTISGKPIMGDANAEGRGEALSRSTMEVKIDQTTKVVDAGGAMTQQRTVWNLRGLAKAQLEGYFPRLHAQTALVQLAGSRGSQQGKDWVVPLASDPDFSSIVVNTVRAPTYNRHLVVEGSDFDTGGSNLSAIDTTDFWTLGHIDLLSVMLDDLEIPLQPVKLDGDPAADDDPIKGVLYLTARQWNQISSSASYQTALQNAWARKSAGIKHPLFTGDTIMWKGILIRKLPKFAVRFVTGDTPAYVSQANRYTGTELTDVAIPGGFTGQAGGYAVERAMLLGAQALAYVFGRNQNSDFYFDWAERRYNFDKNLEVAGSCMGGMSKLRFKFDDGQGNLEPTDNGVFVIDSAVKL